MLRAASVCERVAHPLADLSPGLRQLRVWAPARGMVGQRFGGLREGVPGLAIAYSGGGHPVPLNLPLLVTPATWIF